MVDDRKSEKIQKVLARAGVASRRTVEAWILEGRVAVNGAPAHIGDRVVEADKITVDGKRINHQSSKKEQKLLIYNKPEGEVCTRTDPEGRPTVFDHLPDLSSERWVVVGRLDINSSGLLLFTTDGDLANSLMHPSSKVEREYAVRVYGQVTEAHLDQLKRGVQLEDGLASFASISDQGGQGKNHWYHVVIKEGKKREVRRMWQTQGLEVSRLIRIRFGHVRLPRDLQAGSWRELGCDDISRLSESVGVKLKKRTGLYGRNKVRADVSTEDDPSGQGRRGYLRRKRT